MENVEYYYDIASNSWLPQSVQEEVAEVIEEIQKEAKVAYKRTIHQIDEALAGRMFERFLNTLRK
jgi:hypothetical protein